MSNICKNYFCVALTLFIALLICCQPKKIDLKDYLDGWEFMTTYKVCPTSTIAFVKRSPEAVLGFAEIKSGKNDVLVVSIERRPIYKSEERISELTTYRELLIELNRNDSIVTPSDLGQSRIYRQIIKMSPFAGSEIVKPEEKLKIRKLASNRWRINSELEDFRFEGEFSFADSSIITSKHAGSLNHQVMQQR